MAGSANVGSPCNAHPCQNAGTCATSGGSFTCTCARGYQGAICQTDIDECAASPCQNAGTCSNTAGSYICTCTTAYGGKNCDELRFEAVAESTFSPEALSGDGSTLVGYAGQPGSHRAAKYAAGKLVDLGVYLGDATSQANGVSQNGSLIVGYSEHDDGSTTTDHAATWSGATIELLQVPSGLSCQAYDVSADGAVIVGVCGTSVVRWVSGVFQDLAFPNQDSGAYGVPRVSADGSQIVGYFGARRSGLGFVWTKAGGLKLATSPVDTPICSFVAQTSNGSLVVGLCRSLTYSQGIVWDPTNGVQPVVGADASTDNSNGDISSTSADGSYLAGSLSTGEAVRWDAQRAAHKIATLIPASLTTGWTFNSSGPMLSADGMTLAGLAYDSTDALRAFIMRVAN